MSRTIEIRSVKSPLVAAAVLSMAASGCVSSPPQTVELSDVVLEQVNYIEASHRDLARAYFAQLEYRVNEFIDNEWIPSFLNRAIQDEEVQARLEQTLTGLDIDTDELQRLLVGSGRFSITEAQIIVDALDVAKIQYRVRFSNLMFEFSEAAMKEIGKIRQEWRDRLRDSERRYMSELDYTYGSLRAGHLQIRSYLDSVVQVTQLQDEIARKLGILEERNKVLDGIVTASDGFASGTESLNQVIEQLEQLNPVSEDEPILDEEVMRNLLDDLNAPDTTSDAQ
ncbi:MAG: hypothetical protein QNJ07_13210 [Woeseiaceae bacterium]|nr:hypothetical protein [Woeseiaceae bacterium]